MAEPVIVLVRPQMGENIGSAARAMWNFGLSRMRLVAPRDGWPNPRAGALASGAGRVLDAVEIFDTVAEAVADCGTILASTARPRGLTKPVLTPEAAMDDARRRVAGGEKVAILFGPERAGLENADIARASSIVSVPVNPEFFSLNLAQAVLLLSYEYGRHDLPRGEEAPTPPATGQDVESLGDHFEDRLEEAGFFFPPEKAEGMKLVLRNMWPRLALTRPDVQMLHGALRQLVRGKS